jgi:asparagine N-glycosylation enzyme membrane subunit Stt3
MACITFFIFRREEMTYMLFYIVASAAPVIIYGLSKVMSKIKPYLYVVALFAVIVVAGGVLYMIFPMYVKYAFLELVALLGGVGSSATSLGRTISEAQPLFMPYGTFTWSLVWGGYAVVFFAGFIGMMVLTFKLRKNGQENLLMLAWFLCMFAVTAMQRRFGYYFAVNLCLLTGFLVWWFIDRFGYRTISRQQAKRKGIGRQAARVMSMPVVVVVVIILIGSMIIPNSLLSKREESAHPYAMTPAWYEACYWLRDNTLDTQDYGVISWWDYGYWIAREGKRAVACHPGGGNSDKVAKFFISQSTSEANEWADLLEARYVVIDYLMVTKKFYAMPMLAGIAKFSDQQFNDSMVARLYYSDSGIEGYHEVFESTAKFEGHGQIKIYERIKP